MAGFRIEGNTSGNVAEVDVNNNIKINLPTTTTQAGYVSNLFENDSGSITGSKYINIPFVSDDDRLSVGMDTALAMYNFTSTSQVTGDWKHQFTTMTMMQSAGFLNINPASATVSGNFCNLQSWKYFTVPGDASLHLEVTMQANASLPPANQVLEFGLFAAPATGIAPADGVFFRLDSGGFAGIISYNGVETSTGIFKVAGFTAASTNYKFRITVNQREVQYWIDGVLFKEQLVPAGQAVPFLSVNLPFCMQMRNSGTVSGGLTVKVGVVHMTLNELQTSRPWSDQMASQGNAYQGQEGDTQGSLAIYSNAALAAAAALVNTSAAAQFTGLGGAALVLPTLAAGTDGILFSYQNPLGSVTQPPKTLIVTGVTVDATVQVALTGGPLALVMGVAYGHTAVSLATAESASFATNTTKAPRRVPLCTLGFPVTAAAGTGVTRASQRFVSPIVVNPGEFFAITCRNVATVTSAGALVMTACVDHYFE